MFCKRVEFDAMCNFLDKISEISTLNSLNGLQGSSNLEVALKGNPLFVTVTEEEVAKHLKTLNPNLKLVL